MRPTRFRLQPTISPMMLNFGTYSSSVILACRHGSKEACHVQFGLSLCANPLGELACLPFTSSVADYTSRFVALVCRNNELLTPSQQRFLYTARLPGDLCIDVELQRPSDLHTAISFPQAYEQRHFPPILLHQASGTRPLCPSNRPPVSAATVPSPPAPLASVLPSTTPE